MSEAEKSVADSPEVDSKTQEEPAKKVFKKVPKPDEAAFKAKVDEINAEIKRLNDQVAEIRNKIDEASNQRSGQQGVLNEARTIMQQLKAERQGVKDEMQAIINARNAARDVLDKAMAQNRQMRSELKYTSIDEINAAITRLERQQNTTSMSLSEEKKLIKEMEALKQSKKMVAQYSEQSGSLASSRETANSFNASINEKQAEIKEINERIQAQWKVLESMGKDNDEHKNAVPALIEERNAIRGQIDEQYDALRALRAEHKAANDEYYGYLREQKRLRAEKKKAEYEARQAEIKARQAALEAEEAAKIPYEEEMALCDFLVKYLEDNFVNKDKDGEDAPQTNGPGQPSQLESDGMVLKALKRDDDDGFGIMLGGGGGKKKGKKGKKGKKKKESEGITHALDTLESFSMLSLDPPVVKSTVPASIEAIKAKKKWYSEQPRGSVPRAGKSEEDTEKKPAANGKKKNQKKQDFNAMEEELFPSLPGAKPVEAPVMPAEGESAAAIALAPAPERPIAPPAVPAIPATEEATAETEEEPAETTDETEPSPEAEVEAEEES